MKIIDLLNKIANDEEVPNAIKFNDIIYKKADIGKDYYNFTINKWFFKDVFDASGVNLEVEILEGKKEIPEKLNLDIDELRGKETPRAIDYLIEGKINQIIDYLKSKGDE